MRLASIIDEYRDAFIAKYGSRLLPGHFRAIDAIRGCRTQQAEQLLLQCSDCGLAALRPCSITSTNRETSRIGMVFMNYSRKPV